MLQEAGSTKQVMEGATCMLCAVLCYAVQADQLRKISEMHEEMIANTQIKQVRGGASLLSSLKK